jgi:hypothetical protein
MNYKALNLEPDESVIYEVRKHWVIFLGFTVVLIFIAILPILLVVGLSLFSPDVLSMFSTDKFYSVFFFFYCLWVLTLWMFFFIDWTKYYLDVWYVTEKRIIIVDQRNLFNRQISNVRFDRMQDVSLNVQGALATFLDFGNIKVQTASEDNTEFFMNTVRHPEEVRRIIFSQHNKISEKKHPFSAVHNNGAL